MVNKMSESQIDSILDSIKILLGIEQTETSFDQSLIIFINSALANLIQIGVGLDLVNGFSITGSSETWKDFIGEDKRLNMVKSYVFIKVKLDFDPPTNTSLLESYKNNLKENEYRLYIQKGSL